MTGQHIELPLRVVDTVLRWEQVDEPHSVLAGEMMWREPEDLQRVDQAALAELDERGLVTNGRVDEEFRALMGVLARPTVEYFGWLVVPDGALGVLVASSDNQAVLAIREDETLWLREMRPQSLAETLVAQIPELPPARGRSLNVAEAEVDSPDNPDANLLASLMSEPRSGAGQLYTAVRDNLGRRHRTDCPLSYLDVEPGRPAQGRWMSQTTTNSSGEKWVFAAPATTQGIVAKLNEMNRQLITA